MAFWMKKGRSQLAPVVITLIIVTSLFRDSLYHPPIPPLPEQSPSSTSSTLNTPFQESCGNKLWRRSDRRLRRLNTELLEAIDEQNFEEVER